MPVGARLPGYGVVSSYWVPAATITAFPIITAAMVTAGTNLTNYELPDSKVALGSPQTITESANGDLALTDVPTFATYTGSLHLFRSYGAAGVVGSDDLLAVFNNRPIGYYIRRVGVPNATAAAAAQVVEAYLFQAGDIEIEAEIAGNIKIMVPLLQRGVYNLNIALT